MTGVLSGVRVLDFGRYIAGPYCAALLADFGADVIRVEKCEGSEDRFIQPASPGAEAGQGGEGTMHLQMNRNKRGMTLDPMTEEGREITRRLVSSADVVVANLPPATLASMGLDYDTLRAIKPDIILTTSSAFGAGGPYSDRVGFDGVLQAMSGAAHMTGTPEVPVKSYAPWVDFGTALFSAFGTLAALMSKQQTGKGQMVESALLPTALNFFNIHLMEQALRGNNREAIGSRSPYAGPADMIETKDGWILVQCMGQPLFKRWARLMGEEDKWLADPRFSDDLSRGDNGTVLTERTQQWARDLTSQEALSALAQARIPAGPVYSPQQVLDDPHVQAMDYLKSMTFPGIEGAAPVMDTPVKLSHTPGGIVHRAPLLGEHTDEIMTEIGFPPTEIDTLRTRGII
ncbi:MAG: CoA transferase [Parvibaculaceae bacterium]|nr:CoA transferase [Parvibaculaceae bacterium]